FPEQATQLAASLIAQARTADHVHSQCYAVAMAGCPIALWVGNLDLAEQYIGLMHDQATKYSLAHWKVYCRLYQGVLTIKRGDFQRGLPLLRAGLDEFGAKFSGRRVLMFLAELVEALGRAGRTTEGLAMVDDATVRARRIRELW